MKPDVLGMSQITDALVDEIAREASADRRSVTRRLAGLKVRGLAGARIERALEAHGLSQSSSPSGAQHEAPSRVG